MDVTPRSTGKLMMSMPAVAGWIGADVGATAPATGASTAVGDDADPAASICCFAAQSAAEKGPSQIIVMKIKGNANIIPTTRDALPGPKRRWLSSAVNRLRSARLAGGSGQGRRHLAFGTVSSSSSFGSRPRPKSMRVFWATPRLTWRSDMHKRECSSRAIERQR